MFDLPLTAFLNGGVSPFHVVEETVSALNSCGFQALDEDESWHLVPGNSYYVVRSSSAVIAFRLPQKTPVAFQMAAAHGDSPCLKLKKIEKGEHYARVHVERYGGATLKTWFDRPLSLAGRVFLSRGAAVEEKLVRYDDALIIPSLAAHITKDFSGNDFCDMKTDLLPLLGDGAACDSLESLFGETGKILAHDLYLFAAEPAFTWGNGRFITSGRLDDLQCAYALLSALTEAENKNAVPLFALFNNEEIGSKTSSGADSDFLASIMKRIAASLSISEEEYAKILAQSFMISADNAHAAHPNHPECADLQSGACYMNGGIVIKNNANCKYTTDAFSEALVTALCNRENIPVQKYYNRADLLGGSTLGHHSAAHVPVASVDIGLAQLAMHSAVETAGAEDTEHLKRLMRAFFESSLVRDGKKYAWR